LEPQLGLATQLKTFSSNEIKKGIFIQKLSRFVTYVLRVASDTDVSRAVQEELKSSDRSLLVMGGFIHDVSDFINNHPGGYRRIKARLDKDVRTAFHGGVYEHSSTKLSSAPVLRTTMLMRIYALHIAYSP
jgi:stearoyl-CoA desaturase (Delta-9 desaturase)